MRAGHAPQTHWGQQFDAAMTDVFQVQADIAGQVAQALNVALGDSAKHELASKPTQSLPAYEAFLRGEAASQGMLARPAESPPGDCGVRAGGGARFDLCPGLGAARAGAGIPVWQYLVHPGGGRGGAPRRRAGTGARPDAPRGSPGAWRVLPRPEGPSPRPHGGQHRARPGTRERRTARRCRGSRSLSRPVGGGAGAPGAGCPARSPLKPYRPSSSGTCYSTPAITPRPSGPSITRSSSCLRTWLCAIHAPGWRWRRATCPVRRRCSGQPPRRWTPPRSSRSWPPTTTSCGCWTRPSSGSCCGSRRARSMTTVRTGAARSPRPTRFGATAGRRARTPTRPG